MNELTSQTPNTLNTYIFLKNVLAVCAVLWYNGSVDGVWLSLVERSVRD